MHCLLQLQKTIRQAACCNLSCDFPQHQLHIQPPAGANTFTPARLPNSLANQCRVVNKTKKGPPGGQVAGAFHPAVLTTPCYAEPDILGGLQSIDNLHSSLSLTEQEHLRLRGGAGGVVQKKSDGSRKKNLKSTTTDEAQQESDLNVQSPGKPPNKAQNSNKSLMPPFHFAVNDRIEVSASGQASLARISIHVPDQHWKTRCDAHYKNQF